MENDPLAQLRGLHQPDAVGWWPLALGWWVIIILLIAGLCFYLRKHYLHKQNNLYRTTAKEELEQLNKDYQKNQNKRGFLTSTQKLLRRVALHNYSEQQQEFASLTGQEWQDYLNNCCPEIIFGSGFDHHFTSLPYQKTSDYDQQRWYHAISQWLEQHH